MIYAKVLNVAGYAYRYISWDGEKQAGKENPYRLFLSIAYS